MPVEFLRSFEHRIVAHVLHNHNVEIRLNFSCPLNGGGVKVTGASCDIEGGGCLDTASASV